jgi:hypothetical protein
VRQLALDQPHIGSSRQLPSGEIGTGDLSFTRTPGIAPFAAIRRGHPRLAHEGGERSFVAIRWRDEATGRCAAIHLQRERNNLSLVTDHDCPPEENCDLQPSQPIASAPNAKRINGEGSSTVVTAESVPKSKVLPVDSKMPK